MDSGIKMEKFSMFILANKHTTSQSCIFLHISALFRNNSVTFQITLYDYGTFNAKYTALPLRTLINCKINEFILGNFEGNVKVKII